MVIKKSDATLVKPNEQSTIFDYPMPTENTGVSFQTLSGRLPARGSYRNNVCRELFFIVAGKARLNIDEESYDVGAGDVVVLEPGQKHYGEYENVSMITVSSPNWYEEQCEIVE